MTRTLAMAVVQHVAAATDKREVELPPLDESIDSDALNAIGQCESAKLQFVYAGHTVTIEVRDKGDWRITVERTCEESE